MESPRFSLGTLVRGGQQWSVRILIKLIPNKVIRSSGQRPQERETEE